MPETGLSNPNHRLSYLVMKLLQPRLPSLTEPLGRPHGPDRTRSRRRAGTSTTTASSAGTSSGQHPARGLQRRARARLTVSASPIAVPPTFGDPDDSSGTPAYPFSPEQAAGEPAGRGRDWCCWKAWPGKWRTPARRSSQPSPDCSTTRPSPKSSRPGGGPADLHAGQGPGGPPAGPGSVPGPAPGESSTARDATAGTRPRC